MCWSGNKKQLPVEDYYNEAEARAQRNALPRYDQESLYPPAPPMYKARPEGA